MTFKEERRTRWTKRGQNVNWEMRESDGRYIVGKRLTAKAALSRGEADKPWIKENENGMTEI